MNNVPYLTFLISLKEFIYLFLDQLFVCTVFVVFVGDEAFKAVVKLNYVGCLGNIKSIYLYSTFVFSFYTDKKDQRFDELCNFVVDSFNFVLQAILLACF